MTNLFTDNIFQIHEILNLYSIRNQEEVGSGRREAGIGQSIESVD